MLWGGKALTSDEDWIVLCVTCGDDIERAAKFKEVLQVFEVEGEIWAIPDLKGEPFSNEHKNFIVDKLANYFDKINFKKILTHSPSGEYGHIAHRQISEFVSEACRDPERIYYFHFTPESFMDLRKDFTQKHLKALQIYFNYIQNNMNDYIIENKFQANARRLKLINQLYTVGQNYKFSQYVLKILKRLRNFFIRSNTTDVTEIMPFEDDLVHIEISQYCTQISAVDYNDLKVPKNFLDVFFSNSEIYYKYSERRYMILNYLPSCFGKTLSVGCHSFNKNDYACLPNPKNFETIDIDARYKEYGSPFKHTTIDFLNFKSDYKFQDIILFGVLGIPQDKNRDSDFYSLYQRESDVTYKANSLLLLNGRLLLGPDIAIDNKVSKEQSIKYWMAFYKTNKILNENFLLETRFFTRNNVVLVLRKIRECS